MKVNYWLFSILCILGLVIAACDETPEQQARREAAEECTVHVTSMAPLAGRAELQRYIDQCTNEITKRKLMVLARQERQKQLGAPKEIAYYLANANARQEVLTDCAPFSENIYTEQDCRNARIAQEQASLQAMTDGQDSLEYFLANEQKRVQVMLRCNSFNYSEPDILPCLNANNAEKQIHIQTLQTKTKGLKTVEDFLNNKPVIQDLFRECKNNKYIKDEQTCHTLLEADRIWVLSDLNEKAKGQSDLRYFQDNPWVMREVNGYCALAELEYPFLREHPICKNAAAARGY